MSEAVLHTEARVHHVKRKRVKSKRKAQDMGYLPPPEGAAHPFREAEKKYKLYRGAKTDYSQV